MTNGRKCIGCFKDFDREKMFRILKKHENGEIIVSPTSHDFGRSVYLCKSKDCIEKAFKKGKINKFLKKTAPAELKNVLESKL